MKFSLLLFGLMIILKRASKKNQALGDKFKEKGFNILIKTADGRRGRYFFFSNGAVASKSVKNAASSDVSLVWKDADTGFKVMAAQKDEAFMKAITTGELRIEGNMNLLPVFNKIVKEAMGKNK